MVVTEITKDSDPGAFVSMADIEPALTSIEKCINNLTNIEGVLYTQATTSGGGLNPEYYYVSGATPLFDEASNMDGRVRTLIETLKTISDNIKKHASSHLQAEYQKYKSELTTYINDLKTKQATEKNNNAQLVARYNSDLQTYPNLDLSSEENAIADSNNIISNYQNEINDYSSRLDAANAAATTIQ